MRCCLGLFHSKVSLTAIVHSKYFTPLYFKVFPLAAKMLLFYTRGQVIIFYRCGTLISYIFVSQFTCFLFRKKYKSLTLAKKLCVPHFTAGTVDFNSKLQTYFWIEEVILTPASVRIISSIHLSAKLHKHFFYLLLCIEVTISFLIGRKRTVNFLNWRLWRHRAADYTITLSRTLKVTVHDF